MRYSTNAHKYTHARSSTLFTSIFLYDGIFFKSFNNIFCTEHAFIMCECVWIWLCYHEYVCMKNDIRLSWSLINRVLCSPSARIMLIQLKWLVDPWIKHLVAIYFLLFKTWSFNFKLVFCAISHSQCGVRSSEWNSGRVFVHVCVCVCEATKQFYTF